MRLHVPPVRSSLAHGAPFLGALFAGCADVPADIAGDPPAARREAVTEVIHGAEVHDPYRWMEDPASTEVQAWMAEQDLVFRAAADRGRVAALASRMAELNRFDQYQSPMRRGRHSFVLRQPADTDRTELIVLESGRSEWTTLHTADAAADPSRAIAGFVPSPDGERVIVLTSTDGSVWYEGFVLEVATGDRLPGEIGGFRRGWSGSDWAPDGSAIITVVFDRDAVEATGRSPAHLVRQCVDDSVAEPETIWRPTNERWTLEAGYLSRGDRLIVEVSEEGVEETRLFTIELEGGAGGPEPFAPFLTGGEFETDDGTHAWLRTTSGAPRGRIVRLPLDDADPADVAEVVPEANDETLIGFALVGDHILTSYSAGGTPEVRLATRADPSENRRVKMPWLGSPGGFQSDPHGRSTLFLLRSTYRPPVVYELDVADGEVRPVLEPALAFDPAGIELERVEIASFDGVRVPAYVARPRSRVDRTGAAIVGAYGAFGAAAFPTWYLPSSVAWVEAGGTVVLVGIRGGGEYGEEWTVAGAGRNKVTGVRDLIAATEALVANEILDRDRIIVHGWSASGVLPAAAIQLEPRLFAGALIEIPIADLIRYPRFGAAGAWIAEYGSPDDPSDFAALGALSPYHNVREGECYPPTLIQVGERDEIATPVHGYKLAAALQWAQGCDAPVYLQVAWNTGHDSGATWAQRYETWARQFDFFLARLH